MNWGHKIAIVIIAFVVGMLGMVFYASQQTNEMIDDNYYEKELAYQQVIDGKQNLHNLTTSDIISQNDSEVIISLPEGSFENFESGHIELIRSDAKKKDVQQSMTNAGLPQQIISKAGLSKGMYNARIQWTNNGVSYYKEEGVFVQ